MNLHGLFNAVISTVHAIWFAGLSSDFPYLLSSPVTRSHGVPFNKLGKKITIKIGYFFFFISTKIFYSDLFIAFDKYFGC